MAFGGLKGTLVGNGAAIGATNALTGSVAISVGDLVYVAFGQQLALTATGVTDDLGNSYTALNAGVDAGNSTGRAFYSYVTVAGTLTTATVAATASGNDYAGLVAIIEGPFNASPLDANPANASDATSPFTCPATGTLAQADEVVIAWGAAGNNAVWTATSPNTIAGNVNNAGNIKVAIGYQTVAATTSVVPEFTGTNPTDNTLGTSSFKKAATGAFSLAADTGSFTLTGTAAGVLVGRKVAAAVGSYALTGTAAGLKHGWKVPAAAGSYTLTGTGAGLSHGWKVSAAAGSYTLTGTAATLKHGWKIAAGVGAYTLTGQSANLNKGRNIAAAAGSYVWTGTTAALRKSWKLPAGAGAYTFTGTSASLKYGRKLAAGVGSFLLTGFDADLTIHAAPTIAGTLPVFGDWTIRVITDSPVLSVASNSLLPAIVSPSSNFATAPLRVMADTYTLRVRA